MKKVYLSISLVVFLLLSFLLIKILFSGASIDSTCRVLNISVDGQFTIDRISLEHKMAEGPFTSYLNKVGPLNDKEREVVISFLDENVPLECVSVTKVGDLFEIIYVNKNTNIIHSLNDGLHSLVNTMRSK